METGIERINVANVSPHLLLQISKLLSEGATIEVLSAPDNSEIIRFSNLVQIVINSPITEDDWKLICKLVPSNQLIDLLNHPHPNVFFDENGVMQDAIIPDTLPSLNLGTSALQNGNHRNFLNVKIPMIIVSPLVTLPQFKFPIRKNEKKGPKISYPKEIRDSQEVMVEPEIYLSPEAIKLVVLQSQDGRVNTRILEHNLKALFGFGGSVLFADSAISHVVANLSVPFSDSRTKFIFKNYLDAKRFSELNPTLKVFAIDRDSAVVGLPKPKKPSRYLVPLSKLASSLGLI
jgi:hypothetical protein